MTKEDTIAILDKCIKELENMSEEDFNKSLEEKGLSLKIMMNLIMRKIVLV